MNKNNYKYLHGEHNSILPIIIINGIEIITLGI